MGCTGVISETAHLTSSGGAVALPWDWDGVIGRAVPGSLSGTTTPEGFVLGSYNLYGAIADPLPWTGSWGLAWYGDCGPSMVNGGGTPMYAASWDYPSDAVHWPSIVTVGAGTMSTYPGSWPAGSAIFPGLAANHHGEAQLAVAVWNGSTYDVTGATFIYRSGSVMGGALRKWSVSGVTTATMETWGAYMSSASQSNMSPYGADLPYPGWACDAYGQKAGGAVTCSRASALAVKADITALTAEAAVLDLDAAVESRESTQSVLEPPIDSSFSSDPNDWLTMQPWQLASKVSAWSSGMFEWLRRLLTVFIPDPA